MKTLTTILAFFLLAGVLSAQVTVSPTTVSITEADNNGIITVKNTSNTTACEVKIKMINEVGPSASEFVSIYPEKFLLNPNEEKTVKITANPDDLIEGEFLGVPVVYTKSEGSNETSSFPISLNYSRSYKSYMKGLEFENLSAIFSGAKCEINARFKSQDNKKEISGVLKVRIYDDKGKAIKTIEQEVSINSLSTKNIEIKTDIPEKGIYLVQACFCDASGKNISAGKTTTGEVISRKVCLVIN